MSSETKLIKAYQRCDRAAAKLTKTEKVLSKELHLAWREGLPIPRRLTAALAEYIQAIGDDERANQARRKLEGNDDAEDDRTNVHRARKGRASKPRR